MRANVIQVDIIQEGKTQSHETQALGTRVSPIAKLRVIENGVRRPRVYGDWHRSNG